MEKAEYLQWSAFMLVVQGTPHSNGVHHYCGAGMPHYNLVHSCLRYRTASCQPSALNACGAGNASLQWKAFMLVVQ